MALQFVALLTDLPPGWLLDCATNRRGSKPAELFKRIEKALGDIHPATGQALKRLTALYGFDG
jgi:hypothetical protein